MAWRETYVAGTMPGSTVLVQIISTVQVIYRMMPRKSSIGRVVLFQRGTGATAALKKVAGIFIMSPVKISALG